MLDLIPRHISKIPMFLEFSNLPFFLEKLVILNRGTLIRNRGTATPIQGTVIRNGVAVIPNQETVIRNRGTVIPNWGIFF